MQVFVVKAIYVKNLTFLRISMLSIALVIIIAVFLIAFLYAKWQTVILWIPSLALLLWLFK